MCAFFRPGACGPQKNLFDLVDLRDRSITDLLGEWDLRKAAREVETEGVRKTIREEINLTLDGARVSSSHGTRQCIGETKRFDVLCNGTKKRPEHFWCVFGGNSAHFQ
jgi:hypothetical protein